jgi:hypothetical protein
VTGFENYYFTVKGQFEADVVKCLILNCFYRALKLMQNISDEDLENPEIPELHTIGIYLAINKHI